MAASSRSRVVSCPRVCSRSWPATWSSACASAVAAWAAAARSRSAASSSLARGAHRSRIRGRALLGERNLLGRLRARRGGALGVGFRARELALALRELLPQLARPAALLAQRGQRDRVGGPQELAAPHPLALLAEHRPGAA